MTDFDPGYCQPPFDALCRDCPDQTVYPSTDFRVEWGPVFHRGRLDGTARVLVIGQDPAQHEEMARRILIGVAGYRTQGFLAKLGVDRSYVMVNTFLYSLYGQAGGARHEGDAAIVAYRNRWLDAVLQAGLVEAVVALGVLADGAWKAWKATASPALAGLPYQRITHPTEPESSSGGDPAKLAAAITAMLKNWNGALQALRPAIQHPDTARPLQLYGSAFVPGDLASIPPADLPAGSPAWMLGQEAWADRTGTTPQQKRYTITLTVPPDFRS